MNSKSPGQATKNSLRNSTQPILDKEPNKKLSKRKKPIQISLPNSLTGVNPIRTHGFGWYGNPRVVMGVRVDELLKKQFVRVAKAKFGSVCRPIEAFMASIVAVASQNGQLGVNPSLTIDIGKLVIERNVRTRRKMVVEEETEVSVYNQIFCEWVSCRRPATNTVFLVKPRGSKASKKDLRVHYCDEHKDLALKQGRASGYRPLAGAF